MSEEKFTQGEWVVEDSRAIVCDGFKVAYACSGSNIPFISKVSANAHLIAAAPEMYKMLDSIFNIEHERGGSLGVDGSFHYRVSEDVFKKVGFLLAKARGEL